MDTRKMAVETGAGAVIGLKSGVFGTLFLIAVSVLAVAVGFTVVPLKRGDETRDAARRLCAGLLCSFTLGPVAAIKAMQIEPGIFNYWLSMLGKDNEMWAFLMSALPFIVITALVGFWVVAATMHWFTRRGDKDLQEMIKDATAR